MFNAKITITGAIVDELPGITKPDYPIEFEATYGDRSIDSVAEMEGSLAWEQMHGEKPARLFYEFKCVQGDVTDG